MGLFGYFEKYSGGGGIGSGLGRFNTSLRSSHFLLQRGFFWSFKCPSEIRNSTFLRCLNPRMWAASSTPIKLSTLIWFIFVFYCTGSAFSTQLRLLCDQNSFALTQNKLTQGNFRTELVIEISKTPLPMTRSHAKKEDMKLKQGS